jgi:hypothetical protein
MSHSQKILADNMQIVAQKQIIILMDAASQRIFNGDQSNLTRLGHNGIKDHIE